MHARSPAYPESGKLTGRFAFYDLHGINADYRITFCFHHFYKFVKGIIAALGNDQNGTIRYIVDKSGYSGLPCAVSDKGTVTYTLNPAICTCRDPHHCDEDCNYPN